MLACFDSGQQQLELIAIVYRADELAMLKSRLEWEGIWFFAQGEPTIFLNPGWTLALGGFRLFVHREHAEEARELLHGMQHWDRGTGVYAPDRVMDCCSH